MVGGWYSAHGQVLAELRRLAAAGCVVLGDPSYCARFGFKVEPSLVPSGVSVEYLQTLSFGGTLPAGTVSYHAAFAAHS